MKCKYTIFYANDNQVNEQSWVVFIHGFGGSFKMWERQINLIKPNFNICAVTLPSHGDNVSCIDRPDKNLYTHLAEMITADLKGMGIREVYLVSVSMGTLIANEMLLVDNTFVKKSLLTGAVCGVSDFLYTEAKLLSRFSKCLPYKAVVNYFAHLLLPKESHKKSRKFLITECLKLNHNEFSKWVSSLVENINRAKTLKLDENKCVLVVGDEDFVFKKGVKALAERCHLKLHTIKHCGHVCSLHKWREFNVILLNFLGISQPIINS